MSIISHITARRVRHTMVSAAIAGAGLAGALGLGAAPAHAATNGYVVIDNCSSVAGHISYSPGIVHKKLRTTRAVLTGTTGGCSDIFNGPMSGTGTFTAVLSGSVSLASENFAGTFTINWPASSGFNPSNGSLTVAEVNGIEQVNGTISSGFDTGTVVALSYVPTSQTGAGTHLSPVTAQKFVNTAPLTVSRNEG